MLAASAALFDFKPGQFGVLGLQGNAPRLPEAAPEDPATEPDKMIRRAYSIASSTTFNGFPPAKVVHVNQ